LTTTKTPSRNCARSMAGRGRRAAAAALRAELGAPRDVTPPSRSRSGRRRPLCDWGRRYALCRARMTTDRTRSIFKTTLGLPFFTIGKTASQPATKAGTTDPKGAGRTGRGLVDRGETSRQYDEPRGSNAHRRVEAPEEGRLAPPEPCPGRHGDSPSSAPRLHCGRGGPAA
jgi:hypothetical protein